ALNRAFAAQTNNPNVELLLAMACLGNNENDAAREHYLNLQKIFPSQPQIDSGLAEVAWRQNDTNTALHYYGILLTNVPAGSDSAKEIEERVKALRGEGTATTSDVPKLESLKAEPPKLQPPPP